MVNTGNYGLREKHLQSAAKPGCGCLAVLVQVDQCIGLHTVNQKKVMLPCVCHTLVSLVSLLVLLYTVLLALPVEFNWDRVSSTGDITALPPSASYISVQTSSAISLQVLQAGDPQSPLPLLILLHGFPGTHTGGRTMNLTLVVPQFPPQQQLPTKTD